MGAVCSSIFNKSYVHFRITDKVILHPSLQQLMVIQDDITGNLVYGININMDNLDIKDKTQLDRHQLLTHANILRFEGFKKVNDKEYLVLFESFECTLAEEIQQRKAKNRPFGEQEILGILHNITSALSYFQNKDIYHGAVTSDNIVKKGEEYKLLDLVLFEKYETTYQQALHNDGNEANLRFLSPELREALANKVENPNFKKYKQDVYSLGTIILDAMTLDTDSPTQAKLKMSFQYFSESLVEVVTKMIQESELFRLDALSCYKIIESIYYGFPVAEESDQLILTQTIENQTKSVLSGYEEYEASPPKPIRSTRKGYSVGGGDDASNVIFKTEMTVDERFPRKLNEVAFLQGLGNSIEGLDNKPSAIAHVQQSMFDASKDDWQFKASPKGGRNIDPFYSESLALNPVMDSVFDNQQTYKNMSPSNIDLLGMGTYATDTKMSVDFLPNYNTRELLMTQKTEENEEGLKKGGVMNTQNDIFVEQGTYMQSPSQIKKTDGFSPLRYSSHPDLIANLYPNTDRNTSQISSGKDYFSNTTFGTHPANSIELSSQKLNALSAFPTVGLSTKKLYENLLTESTTGAGFDLMSFTQPSVNQSANITRFKDSSTQMSGKKEPRYNELADSYTSSQNRAQGYGGSQRNVSRDLNIMTLDDYRIGEGHQIHTISEEDEIDRTGSHAREAQSGFHYQSYDENDFLQNYKKHNRNKTFATHLGTDSMKTGESLIANYRSEQPRQKHKFSTSEYAYRSLDLSNTGLFGSDRKRIGDFHRPQQSMFLNGSSSFQSSKGLRGHNNSKTLNSALENLRNEMKNSFLSESDNFLEKRLLNQKKKPNVLLESLQNDIETIKGTQSIDNTKFSIILNESLEREPAPRPSHSHKRSLTLSFTAQNQQREPQKIVRVYEDGLRYEGDMQGDLRHGQGKITLKDGSYYEGAWKLDRIDGYGTLYLPSGQIVYQGEWKNNRYEGNGAAYNHRPNQLYEGYTKKPFDESEKTWTKYEGEFNNHKWHGFGKLTLSNGDVFQGIFRMGIMHGRGNYTSNGGRVVVGEWANNQLVEVF